jgi:hypothetical protein
VYAVLFGFYLNVLRTRGISKSRFIAISTIALFVLCTLHCVFLLVGTIIGNASIEDEFVLANDEAYDAHNFLNTVFYRAANTVYVTSK